MNTSSFINQDALQAHINNEVERLTQKKLEEFKEGFLKDLSQNYIRDDYLLSRKETAKKLDICVRALDYKVEGGKIKSVGQGRSVKFKNSDILEYIKNLK